MEKDKSFIKTDQFSKDIGIKGWYRDKEDIYTAMVDTM